MTRLLFGQAYYLRFDPKLWAAMQPYPPLGALYAASFMRQRGCHIALFDAMLAESETEWGAALDREKPDYAVLYEDNFNYLSKMCLLRMRQAAFTMIGMARQRRIPIIVCGSDATDHAAAYWQQGADYVLIGEGELTLAELLNALQTGDKPLAQIPGLAYGQDGVFQQNPRRPDIKVLDDLPFPAWDLVDVPRYRAIWRERHGYYAMNMVTTRGCPYHCNWCAKPIWGQRYHSRTPQNVVAELKWLKETYQPDYIWFADDILGLKPGWLEQFGALVAAAGVQTPFKCLSRADLLLRGNTVNALAQAGCDIVWIGAESGSQKILNAMEKGTTVAQIYQASARVQQAGFKIGFFLQFGYPGETRQDIELTLQMVRDCQPDDIGMSVSYPLPGTSFHERVKSELGVKQNWVDSHDLEMLYKGPFATEFYRQLHTVLHKEYRSRKAWHALKQLRQQPTHLRPRHLRQIAAMLYHAATLPLSRRRLEQLARLPHQGVKELPPGMTLDDAATPTPQA
ncbi:MAG: radical SAM protein [Candidatus Promineifilaceae bacterium]